MIIKIFRMLAEAMAVIDGYSSLKGPEGLGKFCFCFTRKYFKMYIFADSLLTHAQNLSGHSRISKNIDKFDRVK